MIIKRDQSSLESDKEKKNEKSERSENQRKRMVFFFFERRLDKKNVEFKPQT